MGTCCCPYVSRDRHSILLLAGIRAMWTFSLLPSKGSKIYEDWSEPDLKYSIATFSSGLRSAVGEKAKKRDWSRATIKLTLRLEHLMTLRSLPRRRSLGGKGVFRDAWCVIGPKLASWEMLWPSRVMRDLLFSQRVTRDFSLKFPWYMVNVIWNKKQRLK